MGLHRQRQAAGVFACLVSDGADVSDTVALTPLTSSGKQEIVTKQLVADQLNVTVDLGYRMLVVARGSRRQCRVAVCPPFDSVGRVLAQLVHHQQAEIGLVVEQPVKGRTAPG